MEWMLTPICLMVLGVVAVAAMRRTMLSRTSNWRFYGLALAVAANSMLMVMILAPEAQLVVTLLTVAGWMQLRAFCARRKMLRAEGYPDHY